MIRTRRALPGILPRARKEIDGMLIQDAELEQWLEEADRRESGEDNARELRQTIHSSKTFALDSNRHGRRPRLKLVNFDQRFDAAEAYAS